MAESGEIDEVKRSRRRKRQDAVNAAQAAQEAEAAKLDELLEGLRERAKQGPPPLPGFTPVHDVEIYDPGPITPKLPNPKPGTRPGWRGKPTRR